MRYQLNSTLALLLCLSPLSIAQNAIEEITITADFRNASLRDLSSSITVLDEELIQKKNATHLEEILLNAPNVNFASGASRARFYQIRGIGERGQFAEPLNPSVGLLIDGVDFTGVGNSALLYDVEQVEILMGPQGTRYGSNALAGLINMKTKAPTETLAYGLRAEAGNYNYRGLSGYVSGPLGDSLSYRLSGQSIQSDGFNQNFTVNSETNQRDESVIRGKLRWQLNAANIVDFNLSHFDINNGYDAFSLDNIRDTASDQPGVDLQRSDALSVNYRSESAENFRLEAILAYADSNIDYGYDEDWTFVGFHPWEYSSTDYYYRDRATINGEIRLLSTDNSMLFNDSTEWLVGIYSLQQKVDLQRVYTYLASDFLSRYEINRTALFGETTTHFNNQLSLDLGIRAERYAADYLDSEDVSFDPDDDLWGGKVALNFRTTDDKLIYLSASRGYKSGGFNIDGSLDTDLRSYAAEYLWNYEAGYKGSLLQDTLFVQAAIFLMDRDDVQVSSSTTRLRPDGSTEFIEYTGNAAAGKNYGMELSFNFIASDSLNYYGSLGILKSEYEDFINSEGVDLDGREQAHAPGWQYTIGAEYLINNNLALDINLQGRDAFYFSDSHNIRSDAYHLVNTSLNYQQDNWQLILWGRNLANEDYYVRGYYFGNDPRNGYTPGPYVQFGEPRTFGLTLQLDY